LAGDYSTLQPGLPPEDQLDFGALIGVVDVVGCVPAADLQTDLFREAPRQGDPFAKGPWCWLLANPRPIQPVSFQGQVALFTVPEDLVVLLGRSGSRPK
jgi:hypothetical protein